jgi:hypothetical protein
MPTPTSRGWYDHPDDPDGVQRWHDGRDWTDRTTGVATGGPRVAAEQEEAVEQPEPLPDRRGWHQRASDPAGVLRWFDGTGWSNRATGAPKVADDDPFDASIPALIMRLVPGERPESILATADMSSWWFRSGSTVAVVSHRPPTEARVTVGLASDVPYRAETSHYLNELNRTDLKYGRLFLVGNDESGRGAILSIRGYRQRVPLSRYRPQDGRRSYFPPARRPVPLRRRLDAGSVLARLADLSLH